MQARPSAKEPWLTQQHKNRFQIQNLSEVLDPHALPTGPVTEGSAVLGPRPLCPHLSRQASPCKWSLGRKMPHLLGTQEAPGKAKGQRTVQQLCIRPQKMNGPSTSAE